MLYFHISFNWQPSLPTLIKITVYSGGIDLYMNSLFVLTKLTNCPLTRIISPLTTQKVFAITLLILQDLRLLPTLNEMG